MTHIEEFFARHDRVMLQFSAGKDSAAVLWLLQPWWDKLSVVWANPGNPYPETLEYMEQISKRVPRFYSVLGNQPNDIAVNGWPSDIIPITMSSFAPFMGVSSPLRLRPFYDCCAANMWGPLANEVKQGNYTGVIRGQKLVDCLKNPMPSGTVVDGVEYFYPINDWTDVQVMEFLQGNNALPASYARGLKSSLDCMNCTAYVFENPGRIQDLETIDKIAAGQVITVHTTVSEVMFNYSKSLGACHGD